MRLLAILAAVAVPNFIEAQTRAKISEAKADMRSMAVAIESFRIGGNRYPNIKTVDFITRLIPFTTPVAYMKPVPRDPFTVGLPGTYPYMGIDLMDAYRVKGKFVYPRPFEYWPRTSSIEKWDSFCINPGLRQWALKSIGPSQVPSWFFTPDFQVYDPTNGTASPGAIILVGPGSAFTN